MEEQLEGKTSSSIALEEEALSLRRRQSQLKERLALRDEELARRRRQNQEQERDRQQVESEYKSSNQRLAELVKQLESSVAKYQAQAMVAEEEFSVVRSQLESASKSSDIVSVICAL